MAVLAACLNLSNHMILGCAKILQGDVSVQMRRLRAPVRDVRAHYLTPERRRAHEHVVTQFRELTPDERAPLTPVAHKCPLAHCW